MSRILVIDDDTAVIMMIRQALEAAGMTVAGAPDGNLGWQRYRAEQPDVVILDIMLPDISGLELFQRLRADSAKTPVIVLTARGSSNNAIEAMRLGAFDFLVKPVDLAELRKLIFKALEIRRLMTVPVEIREAAESGSIGADLIVGRSAPMREIYKMIGRVAARDVTVLISGETGTGKELVARAIYQYSGRSQKPFLAVDCSLDESAVELELFGGEKRGTGERQRIGKLEQCAGGTLFLDEISRLSSGSQSKVLHWLQDQTFTRVGGVETLRADVRVLAATSEDLEKAVAQGRFRPDLYYLLRGVMITVPSLRERGEDLPALCTHFLNQFNPQFGKRIMRVAPETLQLLGRYNWPGNIRELQSVIKQALAQAQGAQLLPDFLPIELRRPTVGEAATVAGDDLTTDWRKFFHDHLLLADDDMYAHAEQEMERRLLTLVLRHTQGNQVKAAKLLGITRGNLRNKIRQSGIVIDRQVSLGDIDSDTDSD